MFYWQKLSIKITIEVLLNHTKFCNGQNNDNLCKNCSNFSLSLDPFRYHFLNYLGFLKNDSF